MQIIVEIYFVFPLEFFSNSIKIALLWLLTQTLKFEVYQGFGRVARVLDDFDARLVVVYVKDVIAGDGAILILWRMPGHCDAVRGDV